MKIIYFVLSTLIVGALAAETDKHPCQETQLDASIPGNLSSPFYGEKNYPSRTTCIYRIFAPEGYKIKLTFFDLDIEQSDSCAFDRLVIISHPPGDDDDEAKINNNMKVLGLFCGTTIPRPLLSYEGHNLVRAVFKSDEVIEGKGFLIHYESSPFFDSVCDEGFKTCGNRNCYTSAQKCDGIDHCGDGTDEENCGQQYEKFPAACGLQAIKPNVINAHNTDRVVGGDEAVPNSWPWQVSLRLPYAEPNAHFCGGTLINAQWVLTAAHCVPGKFQPGDIVIQLGAYSKFEKTTYEISRRSDFVITYPNKTGQEINNWNFDDDLSLIKLNTPVQFNDGVQPACLPSADQIINPGSKCYITGWGETRGSGGASVLKQSRQRVLTKDECIVKLFDGSKVEINERTQICLKKEQESACAGDSGGPLNCRIGDKFYVVGAASYVISKNLINILCTGPDSRTVYNSAITKAEWIKETVNKYS